jgi:hypothetical protein
VTAVLETTARRRIGPDQRTALLGAFLAALSLALLFAVLPHLGAVGERPRLPWWTFAVAIAITESMAFHLEVKGQAQSFTLDYVPLVVGLFYASPLGLVCAYVLGGGITLVVRDRQRLSKLTFNLGTSAAEATVAIVMFRLLFGGSEIVQARSWFAALAAVLVAGALSSTAIAIAIRWYGAQPQLGVVLVAGAATATCNTSLALTTALLVRETLAAAALIAIPVAVIAVVYRSYTSLWKRYASLQLSRARSAVRSARNRCSSRSSSRLASS